jgi:hypothetical protein
MKNYQQRNWEYCRTLIDQLTGAWNLEMTSFYDEINNRIMHSACNRGASDRVHIILDLMTKEKGKEALMIPGLAMSIDHET